MNHVFVLHMEVGIVFTLSKTIIFNFWTQSALTHTALCEQPLKKCNLEFVSPLGDYLKKNDY